MKPAIESAAEATTELSPAKSNRQFRLKLSIGQWALVLFAVACLCGVSVVLWPDAAGLGGLAFLIAITLCGAALMFVFTAGRLVSPEAPARLFGAALDTDQRACSITSPDGSIAYANHAWRKLFGRSASGGEVLPVAGFSADPETAQRLYQLVRAASLKEAREEELKLKNVAGKWVHVAVAPVSPQGHTVWRIVDSSPRRPVLHTVDQARQSVVVQLRPLEQPLLPGFNGVEARIPRFIQDAPLGIALIDADGVLVEVNAAFAAVIGSDARKLTVGV